MAGGSSHSHRYSLGPRAYSVVSWLALRKPGPRRSRRHSASSAGGEGDPEAEPGGHHDEQQRHEERPRRLRSTRHAPSSSGERRSGASHRPHHPSSRHIRHSSDGHLYPHHHRISSSSNNHESRQRPRYYTSYSSSAAPRDAPPSSSASASEPDPIPPYKREYVPPSTAPTIPEDEEMHDAYRSDPRASISVGPWDSISVAGLDAGQYQTYMADAARKYKEPPGDATAAAAADPGPPHPSSSSMGQQPRRHYGSGYSSSYRSTSTPPPQYQHGSEVPWEDSAYHSAGGSRPVSSSSRARRALPSYTSHDYAQRQLQQQEEDDVADYAAVEPDPAYTMNSAYATMPGYQGDDGVCPLDRGDEVVEESDRMSFEFEEQGDRRRVRGSHERRVTRTSRGTV
ncbi:hypothetical protein PG985_003012 [Apiospora marii]|uniref:uncharacterized protein n=1 Tax=Apiospora marii TaxID=335849 RepID=UPI00312E748A